jgi:hypothetical protein
MRYLIIFVFFAICLIPVTAQEDDELIQITGRVFDEFLRPLSYAHILILNSDRGTIADREGKFSFVVVEKDTLMFSTLGFKKSIVIVPDDLETPFYTRDVLLKRDTFMIAEVEVYPWKDYEEFKEAFVNLELPDDDLERARKNIALIKTQIILDESPSSSENFNYVMQQQYNETFNSGTYPTYQIFNVFAWSKFIKALKNGDFKNNK